MEPYVMDGNRLVNDVKGYIAQLKTTYFETKDPIDDNEIVLQKLCVKLEIALRHGMKDKYSFLGMRKDYWNFFSECLPKDEGVRYVNSLSQLQTVQGKGRALIRYCLVQKTLADTIQRTLMRHRKKTEWFTPDSLLLNNSISGALIGKLYDLNELEFHLSCTGCDLDMSWPSFGRTFTDGYEKRTRRNSAGSIASTTDFTNERIDPLIALNAEMSALKQMISRELYNEKGISDDGFGENSMSSNDDAQPNISDITLDISRLHQYILKWKSSIDAKLYKAEHEIQRLMEDKDRLSQDSNAQLEQLAERHQNLSDLASKEAALQIIDLQNKLRVGEAAITDYKTKLDSLNEELQQVSKNYRDSQQTVRSMEKDLNILQETTKKLENEICILKEDIEMQKVANRTLTEEKNNLKSELQCSQQSESLLRSKLEESESKLNIKTMEKDKIQEAFENVNGLVFGSFEDFESYYKSQLLDKEKGLEVKDIENKTLQQRLCQLTIENDKLKRELQESLEKTRTAQSELVQDVEKRQKQEDEMNSSLLEIKSLMDTIDEANMNLWKWLDHSIDERTEDTKEEKTSGVRSTEQQCQSLVDNLHELENHVRNGKEALAKVSGEKENLDTQCKSMSVEIKRLTQVSEELKNEKAALLLDKQGNQRDKTELEDQVRVLKEEKTALNASINCLKEEKTDLESELKEISEKLQEENYSKLVLESEVSDITEQLSQVKNEQAESLQDIGRLKMEMEETNNNRKEIEEKLVNCKGELDSVTSELDTARKELETMEELLRKSQDENEEMGRKIASCEEQIANLQSTMDQQVSSLKFQLSSEALKYDEEIKTMSEEKQEDMALRNKIQENEETITELENKLKERNETWQTEKKKLIGDIKLLKNEIKVLNGQIDADKQEIQSMENTLILSKKKCDKEKSRNHDYRKTIKEIKDQKSENEKILEQEKSELEEDIKQLKAKLISLLSDKAELWKRSNQLEFDMKTRISETWVDDKDVTRCPQCRVEFTMFVRKHHCRFCGNVFCRSCSDNFVKTIHSRKPYRSCTSCYKKEKELKHDTSLLSNTNLNQDDSSLSIDSYSTDTEEDITSSPSKLTTDETVQQNRSEKRSRLSSNDQSNSSDDSDENFQVIHKSEHLVGNLFQDDGLSIKHSAKLKPGDGSEDWSEAAIPAGKRYLVDLEGYGGSQIVVEFTTSEKDILFGVSIEETDRTSESKTLIPLCQINSHQRSAKKQVKIASSGVVTLVFDNTHSKSSIQKLRFKVFFKKTIDEPNDKTSGGTNPDRKKSPCPPYVPRWH